MKLSFAFIFPLFLLSCTTAPTCDHSGIDRRMDSLEREVEIAQVELSELRDDYERLSRKVEQLETQEKPSEVATPTAKGTAAATAKAKRQNPAKKNKGYRRRSPIDEPYY